MPRKLAILLISSLIYCVSVNAMSSMKVQQSLDLLLASHSQITSSDATDNFELKSNRPSEAFENDIMKKKVYHTRQQLFMSLALSLPLIFFFWYKRKLYLTLASLLLASFIYEYQLENILEIEHANNEKVDTRRHLNLMATKLQSSVEHNLSAIAGFAAYISATPDLSSKDFDRYAKALISKNPLSVNFAAAKNLIIEYVYPLKGNEQVLGLNYRNRVEQLGMINKIIKTDQILMIGPINLVQGGTAFIGRAPIFMTDGSHWGIISSPIQAEKLFDNAGLNNKQNTISVAIKSYNSFDTQESVIYGNPLLFANKKGVTEKIDIGGMTWELFATNKVQISSIPSNIFALRIYFMIVTSLLLLFSHNRFRQEEKRKSLERDLETDYLLLEAVGKVAKIGGWKLDKSLNILNQSEKGSSVFELWTGIRPKNLLDIQPYFSSEAFEIMKSKINAAFESAEPFDIEFELTTTNDKSLWTRIISDGVVSPEDSSIMGTMQDVTDKVVSENLIKHQATYDSLTGLPNRLFYNDRLNKAIRTAHRNNEKLAILFIDLDRFKPVNDNFGHIVGDQLLVEVANRLKNSLRESDTVSRLSGDEFAVILTSIPQYSQVLRLAEQILTRLKAPFQLKEHSIYLSASIGIALYPNDAMTAEELLRKADQAMYEVKANGRSGCQYYTTEMQLKSEYRHDLLNELIIAIQQNKIEPYYQPIIELQSGKTVKCESLARWQKDDGKFVPPIEFINLAEESGLINKIDLIMLKESSNKLIKDNQDIELSINISPRLFQTKDRALEKWLELIKEMSQSLKITIEITERLLTDDSEKAFEVLNKIKSYGVKIAIDDFGTGYSSLNYLIKFPVDIIKIDRSFVKNIGIDSSAEALIETILAMANRLNIQVIAEGIETQEQLDYLKKNSCDFGQGYLLGKPMDRDAFSEFLYKNILI